MDGESWRRVGFPEKGDFFIMGWLSNFIFGKCPENPMTAQLAANRARSAEFAAQMEIAFPGITPQCTPNRNRPLTGANQTAAVDYTDYSRFDCSGPIYYPTVSDLAGIDFSKGATIPFEDIMTGILASEEKVEEPAYFVFDREKVEVTYG